MKLVQWTLVSALVAGLSVTALTQNATTATSGCSFYCTGTDETNPSMSNHPLSPGEKGGMAETGPYDVVPGHFKPPFAPGWTWGPVAAVHAESPDRVYVYSRGMLPALEQYVKADGLPARNATDGNNATSELGRVFRREHVLTVYDRNGNVIEDWKHLDAMHREGSSAHAINVNPLDPEKHLWLIDTRLNQILKVTRTGRVIMRIGPDTQTVGRFIVSSGDDASKAALAWAATTAETELTGKRVLPAGTLQDMVFLPNGDFFAVEHGRVIKFSKDGNQLMEFGKRGTAAGDINSAHSIAIDSRGRLYIGEHSRIQVFDQSGKSLDIWPNIRFGSGFIALDKNDRLWVADGETHRIAGYDLSGKLLYSWGVMGMHPGQLYGVSDIDVDSQGNVYMAEHYGGRVQMFRPKKGADPKHLIGQLAH